MARGRAAGPARPEEHDVTERSWLLVAVAFAVASFLLGYSLYSSEYRTGVPATFFGLPPSLAIGLLASVAGFALVQWRRQRRGD